VAAAADDGKRQMAKPLIRHPGLRVAIGVVSLVLAHNLQAEPQPTQRSYASPEAATSALAAALRTHDMAALRVIFGPNSERLLSSGDRYADEEQQRRFVAAYDEKHAVVPQGPGLAELDVGLNDWPLPIPIVQSGAGWQFDTKAGAEEIIDRRIGRNELAAIRTSLAYVEAQRDYFARTKQAIGSGFYAERLVSTPGHQDGLYWPAATGEAESPLAPLIAAAQEEGYPGEIVGGKPNPYQGYHFRILRAQGPSALEGAMDYVQSGRMTRGFALIAWPASYDASGIMTFEVNQDGIMFQKDLGPNTAQIVAGITRFDPDLTWTRIEMTDR
jgi:hypothetical protein